MRLSPDPALLAALPYYDLHPLGIEQRRADVLRRVCRQAAGLEAAVDLDLPAAYASLQRIRGIGPWSSARAMMVVVGDPDAVPLGDYHIPDSVAWALAKEPRGTDERMLELLEPYAGQRGRVVRMIEAYAGQAPSFGPKLAPRSFGTQ